jgi:hypothetical protein
MPAATLRILAGICPLLIAAACDREPETRTLLDAAEIYAAHETVFESIRGAYPGPYEDFTRIPRRNPAEETRQTRQFIKALRKNIPVEYVDFFPIGDGHGDELDVVLNRYSDGDDWRTISVIYFSEPMAFSDTSPNVRMFETCDERAVEWLESGQRETPYAAFCKINDSWRAYQRVD